MVQGSVVRTAAERWNSDGIPTAPAVLATGRSARLAADVAPTAANLRTASAFGIAGAGYSGGEHARGCRVPEGGCMVRGLPTRPRGLCFHSLAQLSLAPHLNLQDFSINACLQLRRRAKLAPWSWYGHVATPAGAVQVAGASCACGCPPSTAAGGPWWLHPGVVQTALDAANRFIRAAGPTVTPFSGASPPPAVLPWPHDVHIITLAKATKAKAVS